MSSSQPIIMWFREDLRLSDNPALHAAASAGAPIICVYILEDLVDGRRELGGASRWWLHHSLDALSQSIADKGGRLVLAQGNATEIIPRLAEEIAACGVHWNRRYDAAGIGADKAIKSQLKESGIRADSFNGRLLTEPWEITTNSGNYYKVFTPYWKSLRSSYRTPEPLEAPASLAGSDLASENLSDWGLLPRAPDWAKVFSDCWKPGEAGAAERLDKWLDTAINDYDENRNRPDIDDSTSGLSPHLRWGEISPVQVWRCVRGRMEDGRYKIDDDAAWTFLSEIAWREFSYVLLYHNQDLARENYNADFSHMPWREDEADYERWKSGKTGFPIVDAGMRQLWEIGWMHNRVRMIVGSFLTKHLLLPWQKGEDWFWDTLVDADPASNAAGWQWVAGSGADAAPYFRVFNPITQGSKFDASGAYVRRWCPELKGLPDKYLHSPWEAPEDVLKKAGITLGETYPRPMIEHKAGRQRALDAYDTLKERRQAL